MSTSMSSSMNSSMSSKLMGGPLRGAAAAPGTRSSGGGGGARGEYVYGRGPRPTTTVPVTPTAPTTTRKEKGHVQLPVSDDEHDDGIDEEEEEDGGVGDYDEEAERITTAHMEIMTKMRRIPQSQDEEGFMEQLDLSEEEVDSLVRCGEEKRSLLHHLVQNATAKNAPTRRYLAAVLLQKNPELLAQKDDSGQTPLNLCIARGRDHLLEYFLDRYADVCRPVLNEAGGKGCCLHAAIQQKLETCAEKMLPLLERDTLLSENRTGNTPLHLSVDVSLWLDWISPDQARRKVNFIHALIEKCEDALKVTNSTRLSPYQYHLETLPALAKLRDGPKKDLLVAEEVAFMLKNACVHLPSPQETKMVLYGQNPGPLISLDLSELAGREEPLPEDYLDRLEHLALEDILKHVYLPKLATNTNSDGGYTDGKSNGTAAAQQARRSISFNHIFEWLQSRGVKKIIKIVVVDDDHAPHGDDAIETALKPFDVEVFDWRKLDLSSETIRDSVPNVTEVVLYSRANRAVLRGWSASDGLVRLSKLHSVQIKILGSVEGKKRTNDNLEEFRRRLSAVFRGQDPPRDVTVDIQWDSSQVDHGKTLDPSFAGQDKKETDTWLKTMREFENFIINIPSEVIETRLGRPIRIAILDDGVDVFSDELEGKIKDGQSFCHTSRRDFGESNYFVSAGGHGTAMAVLVCRVFRSVELFVVKLHGAETGQPTAESAAQGVRWAVSKGVDIISMSWSIVQSDLNRSDVADFVKEVGNAHQKKILMFCAATDEGRDVRRDQIYPASCKEMVFCIGAAKSSGQTDSSVGEQMVDFTVPGKVILGHGPSAKPLQGSSVSTALAAGLAGLILFCVGLSAPKYFTVIHEREYMEKVLRRLSRSDADPRATLIRVRDHFAGFEQLDWDYGGKKKLDDLATRLLLDIEDAVRGGRLARVKTGLL